MKLSHFWDFAMLPLLVIIHFVWLVTISYFVSATRWRLTCTATSRTHTVSTMSSSWSELLTGIFTVTFIFMVYFYLTGICVYICIKKKTQVIKYQLCWLDRVQPTRSAQQKNKSPPVEAAVASPREPEPASSPSSPAPPRLPPWRQWLSHEDMHLVRKQIS